MFSSTLNSCPMSESVSSYMCFAYMVFDQTHLIFVLDVICILLALCPISDPNSRALSARDGAAVERTPSLPASDIRPRKQVGRAKQGGSTQNLATRPRPAARQTDPRNASLA